jgi:hypothetical protein
MSLRAKRQIAAQEEAKSDSSLNKRKMPMRSASRHLGPKRMQLNDGIGAEVEWTPKSWPEKQENPRKTKGESSGISKTSPVPKHLSKY